MRLERLIRADAVAWVAALALLLVTAVDWYSTEQGEEARRIEDTARPGGGAAGQAEREVEDDARIAAEDAEQNAWQPDAAIDFVILAVVLVAAALAILAGVQRARGRRYEPPLTPSALAAAAAALGAALVVFRILDPPGPDEGTTIELGAPLALVALGVLALGAASALRAEEAGTAWRNLEAEDAAEANGATEDEDAAGAEDAADSSADAPGSESRQTAG